MSAGGEFEVGSHGVNEPAILASHVDDQRLAGRAARVDVQGLDVHAVSHQGFGGKTSKDVVADTGADGDTDAQPGEVHGGVGGSAADVENKLIDQVTCRRNHPDAHRTLGLRGLARRSLRRVLAERESVASELLRDQPGQQRSWKDTWSPKRPCGKVGTRR